MRKWLEKMTSNLSLMVAILTVDILPREVVVNEHGVYLHSWRFTAYEGKEGCFHINLARRNGLWGSSTWIDGRSWGSVSPLWDGDFKHPTIEDALLAGWSDLERVSRGQVKFYNKAKKAFDTFMALPFEEKISRMIIRD